MKEIDKLSPKEAFLQQFKENFKEDFLPPEWDDRKRQRVEQLTSSGKIKTSMFTSIPMICMGPKCVFASTCPLQRENLAPVGYKCPIEMSLIYNFMNDYMQQMDVDPEDMVEVGMIRELVDQDVQSLRKSKMLAKESFIQENIIGIDSDGDPVMKKELHLAIDYEDKIFKRRQFLLKALLATREAKNKAGMNQMDPAQVMSSLLDTYKKAKRIQDEEMIRSLGLAEDDVDDYIDIPPEDIKE